MDKVMEFLPFLIPLVIAEFALLGYEILACLYKKRNNGTVSLGQIDDSRHTVCSARRYESGCCKNNTLAA